MFAVNNPIFYTKLSKSNILNGYQIDSKSILEHIYIIFSVTLFSLN